MKQLRKHTQRGRDREREREREIERDRERESHSFTFPVSFSTYLFESVESRSVYRTPGAYILLRSVRPRDRDTDSSTPVDSRGSSNGLSVCGGLGSLVR